ncbi:hypothetical protein ANN_14523 [Periplaneta americana]|uniref:Uncharacterized protein n=1 Tax=Periplaneta americana TaxID=6978 RepID=A0ABQ8SXS2_PERAM|nr:hypothetical protein ANN_14523 [Periplaneta americana]
MNKRGLWAEEAMSKAVSGIKSGKFSVQGASYPLTPNILSPGWVQSLSFASCNVRVPLQKTVETLTTSSPFKMVCQEDEVKDMRLCGVCENFYLEKYKNSINHITMRVLLFQIIVPGIPLPPQPVLSRWGTWLDAVNYYAEHYSKIMEVNDALNSTDSSAVAAIKSLPSEQLLEDILFIDSNFKIVSKSIILLESSKLQLSEALYIVDKSIPWFIAFHLQSASWSSGRMFAYDCFVRNGKSVTSIRTFALAADCTLTKITRSQQCVPITKRNSVNIENRTHVYMTFFAQNDFGNKLRKGRSAQAFQEKVNELNTQSKAIGLTVNSEKAKIMTNGQQSSVQLDNTELQYVSGYKYLGQHVAFKQNTDLEIKRRITLAWKTFWSLKFIFLDKTISRKLRFETLETRRCHDDEVKVGARDENGALKMDACDHHVGSIHRKKEPGKTTTQMGRYVCEDDGQTAVKKGKGQISVERTRTNTN